MNQRNIPSIHHSALVVGGVLTVLAVGLILLKANIHSLLLISIAWTCLISYLAKHDFRTMKSAMSAGISRGLTAIYIFILIGVLVSAFISSGTVPTLVYYGLDLISPNLFLPATMLICSLMSLATGTSWGTVGTIGVVLIGLGTALGVPPAAVAGAIVSGAVFGDKMSPVSDTTVLASVSAETDLYKHIKSMLISTVPAYVICFLIFLFYNQTASLDILPPEHIISLQASLTEAFNISFWTLIPIASLLIMSMRGVAAEIAMTSSIVLAIIIAVSFQGTDSSTIFSIVQNGYVSETGNAIVDKMLSRGGIQSIMWTLSLVIIGLALGGLLDELSYIRTILSGLIKRVKRPASLISLAIFSSFFFNLSMGTPYLSIILGGQLFKDAFKSFGLDGSMLSRCLEEGATCTGVLIPWTAGGAFFMSMLGISAFEYAPWAFFNLLNPIISIFFAYIGIGIIRKKQKPEKSGVKKDQVLSPEPATK